VLHSWRPGAGVPGLQTPRRAEALTFEVKPWNMKEFYVHDPHRNLPRFGREEW
jgi:hypothetical protein